jgi:toxin ParE1/3/4
VIIRLTPPARAQLLAAVAYLQAGSPAAALDFRTRVERTLRRLIDFPDSGRVVPEFDRLGFREVLVDSHRFFCRVQGEIIWVVGVWHDAQMPSRPAEPNGI